MLKQFLKYLISHAALADALDADNDHEALKLIAQGKEVIAMARYGSYTFLQRSLLAKKPACTIALLEYRADPNAPFQGKLFQGLTTEREFMLGHVSNIMLLMLYGGQVDTNWLEKIKDSPKYDLIKKLVEDKNRSYQKIKELRDSLNSPLPAKQQVKILRELAQLWANEAADEEEGEPIYKQHYNKKASEYEQRAIKLEEGLQASTLENRITNIQEPQLSEKQQERVSLINKLKTH